MGLSPQSAESPVAPTVVVWSLGARFFGQISRRRGSPDGHALLFGETPGEKRRFISAFAEMLFRLAALARDFPEEIVEIELPRVAVLPGGDVEIREARIEIGDAFTRRLVEAP